MSDFGADDIRLDVDADLDEGQVRSQADAFARIFEEAMTPVINRISKRMAREFSTSFRQVGQADGALKGVGDAARQAASQTALISEQVRRANADTEALQARAAALRDTLRQAGADQNLFSVVDREIKTLLSTARELEVQLERGVTPDPERLEAFSVAFKRANDTFFREVAGIQSALKARNQTVQIEANRALRIEDRAAQERIQNAKLTNSRLIVEEQGLNSQRLAETRIAGRRQLAAEQARARTRIELVRFTFRQIQQFERAIAGTIRGTSRILGNVASATGSAVSRIAGVFRRSNREINEGLNGALIQREQTLSRSFRRQTSEINTQVTRQTAILERFERQAATGVAGAVTGRSRLGGLLGGGLAVGGGFLLARQLREGFEETVNLNEAMNKTREIFGEATDSIVRFSDRSVEALFSTRSEALAAASDFGIFGRAAGLSGSNLAGFSTTLTQLATDLASFNNTSVQDATTALAAGLRGEQEPLRRYGVLLDQAVLKQRALELGIIATERTLTPAERVLAAYAEILSQTAVQQGDAARTADDFANSSRRAGAALTETFAAATRGLIPLAEIVTNRAFPILQSLTRFIEGDVSPALRILRTGLIGAGAALGLLLTARVAGEAIQFLGLTLRFALTPLGLLVTGVAAAGAAIAIFSERSERFAAVMRGIVILLRRAVVEGIALAGRGLQAFGALLQDVILPAVGRFAAILGGVFLTALRTAGTFIGNFVLPAIFRLAEIIEFRIIPAFRSFGSFVIAEVVPALRSFANTAVDVLRRVVEFIQPAIDGFRQLGDAIVAAFQTGDFSGLLGGLGAVAAGIGQVFANLGVLIYEALRPQVERAVGFLSEAFRNINYGSIASSILEVVRIVGFVLGSIVSDPRFIQALEIIAAAAIAVGVKFIQGFVQGVASNLPELGRLLGGQIREGLRLAITYAFANPRVIGAAILTGLAARAILSAFSRAGERGAAGFARGFAQGYSRSLTTGQDVVRGLFGGPRALEAEAARQAQRANKALLTEFQRGNRELRALGQKIELIPRGGVTQEAVENLNRRLADTRSRFTEAGASAALFRDRATRVFSGLGKTLSAPFVEFGNGARSMRTAARVGVSQVTQALGDGFARLRAQGRLSGAAIGNAVLAGFGAVISGQQLGQGNTAIGLSGILASAIGAGLATSSPAIGAAVGGIGLLTSFFERGKQAAREAAEQVDGFADAIVNAGSVIAAQNDIARQVLDSFRELDVGAQEAFAAFDLGGFVDQVTSGADPVDTAFKELADSVNLSSEQIAEVQRLIDQFGVSGVQNIARTADVASIFDGSAVSAQNFFDVLSLFADRGGNIQEAIREAGVATALLGTVADDTAGSVRNTIGEIEEIDRQIGLLEARTGVDLSGIYDTGPVRAYQDALRDTSEVTDVVTADLRDGWMAALEGPRENESALERFVTSGKEKIRDIVLEIQGLAGFDIANILDLGGFIDYLASLGASTDDITDSLTDAFGEENRDLIASMIDEAIDLGDSFDDVRESVDLIGPAITELNRQRTDRVNSQIEGIRSRLDEAKEAADRARESLTDFITAPYVDTAQALVDRLIGNVGSIGSAIEEGLLQGGIRGDAAVRSAVGDFQSQIASIIQAGADQGLRSQDQFRNLLAPLFGAVSEEAGDAAARILSNVDFTEGISPEAGRLLASELERVLAGNEVEFRAAAVTNAEEQVRRIERELNTAQASLDVDITFDLAQVERALRAAGANQELIVQLGLTEESVAAAQASNASLVGAVARAGTVIESQDNSVSLTFNGYNAGEATTTAVTILGRQNAQIAGVAPGVPF